MLAGRAAVHRGDSAQAIIAQDHHRAAACRCGRAPDRSASRWCGGDERALEKLPADRFASARELAAAMEDRAPMRDGRGRCAGGSCRRPRDDRPPIRRTIVLAPWAAAATLAVVAALGWFRPTGTAPPVQRARFALVLHRECTACARTFTGANLAFSPDGTRFVFLADSRTRACLSAISMPSTRERFRERTGAVLTALFADGRLARVHGGTAIEEDSSVAGGQPLTIAWASPRHRALFVGRRKCHGVLADTGRGLYRVSASGASRSAVTDTGYDANMKADTLWPEVLPGWHARVVFAIASDTACSRRSGVGGASTERRRGRASRRSAANPRYVR